MAVRSYDPRSLQIVFAGKLIQGFAPGTFLTITRNMDAYALSVGVDGIGTRIKNNNLSGRATFTLDQSSSSNDDLNALASADELSDTGVGPFFAKDGSGNTVAAAATAWIVKLPDSEFSNALGTRQWILETDVMSYSVGGSST